MTQTQQPSEGNVSAPDRGPGREEEIQVASSDESRRPPFDQPAAWRSYWREQGQFWRTEPEIDLARQEQLAACRTTIPDPRQGLYPFKGLKLSRADIEWLLATHENGKGPIDWQDESQRQREGLDLRGAILSGEADHPLDLRGLPLARLKGGLVRSEWSGWVKASQELLASGAINLEGADLFGAHLEGAYLTAARLAQADLRSTYLEGANFTGAHLHGANLTGAYMEGANLTGAQLEGVYLTGAQLTKANLHGAQLNGATLFGTQLKEASLLGAHLEGANLTGAQLESTDLRRARLGRAILSGKLEKTDLTEAILADADGIGPRLAAVQWGSADLSTVDWSQIRQLGDEHYATQTHQSREGQENALPELSALKQAVKAYRQLALALRNQALSEEAAYFSYRAHLLHRAMLRRQIGRKSAAGEQGQSSGSWLSHVGRYLCSSFLDLTTGYGYKPQRSVITYVVLVILFALAYTVFNHTLSLPDAVITSLAAFHGRGLFPGQLAVGASTWPNMGLITLEAIAGLLIEISYIVVFTRRLLER